MKYIIETKAYSYVTVNQSFSKNIQLRCEKEMTIMGIIFHFSFEDKCQSAYIEQWMNEIRST